MTDPQIQYATTSDGVSIAFFTEGEGMPCVVVPGMPLSNVQRQRQLRPAGETFEFLASRYRLVAFDRRGFGLSQRDVGDFALDKLALDVEAVVDHLGLEKFALFAAVVAGPPGIAYAAHNPDRVSHLILANTFASGAAFWRSPRTQAFRALREADWDTYAEAIGRFAFDDPREGAAFVRESGTPETARMFMDATEGFDVSPLLSELRCPTLVVYSPGGTAVGVTGLVGIDPGAEEIRRLAAGIAGARLVVVNDAPAMYEAIEKFLEGEPARPADRPAATGTGTARTAVHTILFTDVEGSTALTQRLGDAAARDVLREHERVVRDCLSAHAGSEVKTMGDGFMASFPSAAGALDCAIAIQRGLAQEDSHVGAALAPPQGAASGAPTVESLRVRIGLNSGEPIAEEGDLFGTAVIAAARIAAQASGGEVLVSNVVRELVAGKGFLFADRGDAVLRGFEDPVRLYELRWREE
ncbi:MAG: adenylate/guanylate cyclase domain-containing protein [Dehalococcoidia bacterium]